MTFLETAFAWLAAGKPPHWWTIAKMIFLFAPLLMLSVANALTKHYADVDRAKRVSRALLFLVDIFSFFASKGSPDVLKLPGVPSAPPAESPLPPLRDKDDRDPPGTGGSVIRIVGAALLAIGVAGCASFSDGAHRAKGVVATALYQSAETWVEYDRAKQLKIVEDSRSRTELDQRLLAHRTGEQAKVAQGFRAARHALELLAKALDTYDAGAAKQPDVAVALAAAIDAARSLLELLRTVGVQIPELPL